MKHTLPLVSYDGTTANFGTRHKLIPFTRRMVGDPPYGPFSVSLGASMHAEDWKAAGQPLVVAVDL